MDYTPNYNLKKPSLNDTADIEDINYNMDILDSKVKSLEKDITTNKNTIDNLTSNLSDLQQSTSNDHAIIVGQQSKIEVLETLSNTNKSNISSLTNTVNTNKNNITNLTTRVTTAEKNITTNKTDIANLNTRVTNIEKVLKKYPDIHVSPNGNDTTGDGSKDNPYKTIKKAVSMIPSDLNSGTLYIRLDEGIYDEGLIQCGHKRNGLIQIMPSQISNPSAEKYIIKGGLYLYNNIANVSVSDITISGKNNNYYCVSVYNSTSTEIDKCIFENSNYTYAKAVAADMNSMVNIKNCKINDMYNGFYASQNSKSAVYNCNGTVKIGYEATTGGLIQVGMTSGNALNCSTSEAKTSYGGKVFIGSASGNKEY